MLINFARKINPMRLSCYLIKDGLIWTDEAPLEHFSLAIRIDDGVTDMEQLTVVGHISIVSIHSSFTGELVHNVLSDGVSIRDQTQGVFRVIIIIIIRLPLK